MTVLKVKIYEMSSLKPSFYNVFYIMNKYLLFYFICLLFVFTFYNCYDMNSPNYKLHLYFITVYNLIITKKILS